MKLHVAAIAIVLGLAAPCLAQDRRESGPAAAEQTTVSKSSAPQLLDRVKQLCRSYTEGFVHPATDLAYGKRLNGPRGIAVLESPAEIAKGNVRGEYRPWGYGSGIEDLAYHNGMLLFALCDAEQSTGDPFFAEMARRAFRGLRGMSTLSKAEGFVPRGPHPDGKSYYPNSSRDQHSLYVCGLWRYHRSRLASETDRQWIGEMVAKVLRRLERDGWSFQVEDGSMAAHAGGSMLKPEPTTAALLLMMLAAAHDLTGDAHWKEAYDRFGSEEDGRRWTLLARRIDRSRDPRRPRWTLFNNQDALRTETLRRIEASDERRTILRGRIADMAQDMLSAPYFRSWRRLDWIGDEPADTAEADAVANTYLKPLGLSVESSATVMDLWKHYDPNRTPTATLGRRSNRYEPILLATPAMVWQIALLSESPELTGRVRPAVSEMLQRVDFQRLDSAWAYNYAVLAALWDLAKSP